jgi:hypothetical protein
MSLRAQSLRSGAPIRTGARARAGGVTFDDPRVAALPLLLSVLPPVIRSLKALTNADTVAPNNLRGNQPQRVRAGKTIGPELDVSHSRGLNDLNC